MNCIKCNAPNPPAAKFCAKCGAELIDTRVAPAIQDDQVIKSLLIVIGLDYLGSAIMFIIQKFVMPSLQEGDGAISMYTIYQYVGWSMDIITIGVLLYFLVTIKHNLVKNALIVFIVLKFIFLVGYRVFNHM